MTPPCKAAITIRTFNLGNDDLQEFSRTCTSAYPNTTGRRLSEEELIQVLPGSDVVIAGTEPFSEKVLNEAKELKIISRVGVGLDSIDLDAAEKRDIIVLSTPFAPVTAVAEHTIAFMLGLLKRIPYLNDSIKADRKPDAAGGTLLAGKTVGIIGMGRIGQKTASLLDCLGCRIRWYDPFLSDIPRRDWVRAETLRDLVFACDIVSLHAPGQADKRPLFDAELFSHCKKGIFLINTARGSLIDEDALLRALDDGTVAGAALDVQPVEPYHGPLTKYRQVILTPHVASNTEESRQQMEKEAVTNIIRTLERMA